MATLTVTTTVALTLNNIDYGFSETSTIAGVTQAIQRRLNIPTASEVKLLEFAATVGAGTLTALQFLYIKNIDPNGNFIRLRLNVNGGDTFDIKIPVDRAVMFHTRDISVDAAEGAFAAFSSIDEVQAQADTLDVEIFMLACE